MDRATRRPTIAESDTAEQLIHTHTHTHRVLLFREAHFGRDH